MTHAVISKNVDEVKDLEVMIIGGGDLIIAAYILNKYSEEQVRKVTVVEIDERVIELTK
jgi:spermidine synthase